MSRAHLYNGDALAVLKTLPDGVARCCVSSPPYWGLRDYGVSGQLGLEKTPEEYVENMVAVFREVRRVLADDGTLWLNVGDSYCSIGHKKSHSGFGTTGLAGGIAQEHHPLRRENNAESVGAKHKDLVGIPWMLAFALRADGWFLRSDIIWSKPNPMPESVTDRPTKAHEYVFLLAKEARYYYDAVAIRRPMAESSIERLAQDVDSQQGLLLANGGGKTNGTMKAVGRLPHNSTAARKARANPSAKSAPTAERNGIRTDKQRGHRRARHAGFNDRWDAMKRSEQMADGANECTVWTIATQPYAAAHFATFPEELARRCILAGSAPGDTVLDPFGGSGTVAQVATGNGRDAIYIDLNPKYLELAEQRIGPLLCEVV